VNSNHNSERLPPKGKVQLTKWYRSIPDGDGKYALIGFLQLLLKIDLVRKSEILYNDDGPLWLLNDFSREDFYVLSGFRGYERLPW
jgi:hypothetical protein